MTTKNTLSPIWDQESFDLGDRRRSKELAVGAEKQYDLLYFDIESAAVQFLHSILQEHTRHTDSVHTHDDAVCVSCAPGEAPGLRAKLEPHFKAKNISVRMNHNTFATSSELKGNLESLKTH